MNEKFCPFISENGKKRACQKNECILYNTEENTCNLNNSKKNEITISDGCKIAIGFTIWSIGIAIIIFIFIWIITPTPKECSTNPFTGETTCK